MEKFHVNFLTCVPFFRLTLIWISGIILAINYPISLTPILILLGMLLLGYIRFIRFRQSTHNLIGSNVIGIITLLTISYTNVLLHTAQQQSNLSDYLSNHQSVEGYQARINKVCKTPHHAFTCQASITHIRNSTGWHRATLAIQLFFPRQCGYTPVIGDTLLIRGRPTQTLSRARTMHQYRLSDSHNQTFYHHTLPQNNKNFLLLENPKFYKHSAWPIKVSQWSYRILKQYIQDEPSIAMIRTLLFGEQNHFNQVLRNHYIRTGTIHVLVVSGLHVNMLYTFVKTLLKYVFIKKFAAFVDCLALLSIWLYAGVCYFTSPILRTAIMITLAKSASLMQRTANSYNGLFASACALLVWDPFLLFNIGFQLSYVATLSILYLQPLIYRQIYVRHYVLKAIWSSTTVSISAQLGTLPLSIYYFKQLPLYFIIANWVIVPAIFIILILSFTLMIGGSLPFMNLSFINTLLAHALHTVIWATNAFVCWIAQWPYSTLHIYSVDVYTLFALYVAIISICCFFQYKNLIYLVITSICAIWHATVQIKCIIQRQSQYKIIFANQNGLSVTLKDPTHQIHFHDAQKDPVHTPYIRFHGAGIIGAWHGKSIVAINAILPDWCNWNQAKLDIDYLCIPATLLSDIDSLFKVFNLKILVICVKQTQNTLSYYAPIIHKLGIQSLWLTPNATQTFIWTDKQ